MSVNERDRISQTARDLRYASVRDLYFIALPVVQNKRSLFDPNIVAGFLRETGLIFIENFLPVAFKAMNIRDGCTYDADKLAVFTQRQEVGGRERILRVSTCCVSFFPTPLWWQAFLSCCVRRPGNRGWHSIVSRHLGQGFDPISAAQGLSSGLAGPQVMQFCCSTAVVKQRGGHAVGPLCPDGRDRLRHNVVTGALKISVV